MPGNSNIYTQCVYTRIPSFANIQLSFIGFYLPEMPASPSMAKGKGTIYMHVLLLLVHTIYTVEWVLIAWFIDCILGLVVRPLVDPVPYYRICVSLLLRIY